MNHHAKQGSRKWNNCFSMAYAIKAVIAIAALAWLYWFSDTKALATTLRSADYRFVVLGMGVFLYGQYLAAQRWHLVLAEGAMHIPRLAALRLNLMGTFIGNFLPGQGGGDLSKAAFLFHVFPEQKASLLASVVYDRILGMLAILILAGAGALIVGARTGDWRMASLAGWGLLFLVSLVIAFLVARRLLVLDGLLQTWFGKRLGNFSNEFFRYFRSSVLFRRCLALSVVFQLLWAASVWLMMHAVSDAIPFAFVILAAPLSVLIATLPVSLGGLGVREGMLALILHQLGIEASAAAAGAVLSLAPLLFASLLGALLMLSRPK